MAWDHVPRAPLWTRAALQAIQTHGQGLVDVVPTDIGDFCPKYPRSGRADRAAFWSGMLSILAKMESTWQPGAEGGGGQWIGLLQIAPSTASAYGCRATTVSALKDGAANLSCAVRIASAQVMRDGVVMSDNGNWRGLARDWAPFRSTKKRVEMTEWIRSQAYCTVP